VKADSTYDGYFMLPNEIPKSEYNKIDKTKIIKRLNKKINKAENELLNKYPIDNDNESNY